MKNTENTLQKGSIYLSHFPFTNLSQSKIRPIVVLAEDSNYNDVIVLAVSSIVDRWDKSAVVYISSQQPHFPETGLKKDSFVLLNRIATIQKNRLFKKLGQLPSALDQEMLSGPRPSLL